MLLRDRTVCEGPPISDHPDEFAHFVAAQQPVYAQVLRELAAGRKYSHWMWFIFPQVGGLGRSSMSRRFALDSVDQARRYLAHPLLGPRLRECTTLVLNMRGGTIEDVFGHVDGLKFHACMTLFSLCSEPDSLFAQALARFFAGAPHEQTMDLLGLGHDRSSSGCV